MPLHKTTQVRIEAFALIAGIVLLAFLLRFEISVDGAVRYRMLQMLIDEHRIPPGPYSLLQCLGAAPLYILGKAAGHPEGFVERFNVVVFCGMLFVLYQRLSRWTEASLLWHWFLLMLTGSMFLHHLRMFFTEVFSTASVVIGLAGIVTNTPVAGALAMSIGVINSPAMIVPLTLIVLKMAWDDRKFWYFLMPIASLVGICVEAWVRRGSPFLTGYEGDRGYETQLPYSGLPGFSYPFILGVLSILFSFGKGLFFFVPGLVLCPKTIERTSVRGPLRRLQELLLLFVAGMILVYAKWWAWYGGWYWGPRFFLLACVPASLALAIHLRDFGDRLAKKVFVLSLLILSVWVAIDGAIFG